MGIEAKKKTKDFLAQNLTLEILSGGIEDGEELKQDDIAEKTGLSRMPVREALALLERTGMARRLPNRHIVAVGPTARRVRGTFQMLAQIETELVRQLLAAGDGPALDKALARYGEAPSAEAEWQAHEVLSRATGIYPLENMHRNLLEGYFLYAVQNSRRAPGEVAARLAALREALAAGTLPAVGQILREYFDDLALDLIRVGNYK